MKRRVFVATVLLGGLLGGSASATPISGTFNISGAMTLTPTSISWSLTQPPHTAQEAEIAPGGTGDFGSLAASLVTIQNINSAVEPTGVSFPAQPFISFLSAPSFPVLNIDFINAGIYSAAQCSTLPAAVGQQCTSPLLPYLNFVNNPPPAPAGPMATGTFVFTGVTSDGLENWTANFTFQSNVPYQTLLNSLATNGSLLSTYSATFTVTPNGSTPAPVPEPASMLMLGGGLGSFALKKFRRKSI